MREGPSAGACAGPARGTTTTTTTRDRVKNRFDRLSGRTHARRGGPPAPRARRPEEKKRTGPDGRYKNVPSFPGSFRSKQNIAIDFGPITIIFRLNSMTRIVKTVLVAKYLLLYTPLRHQRANDHLNHLNHRVLFDSHKFHNNWDTLCRIVYKYEDNSFETFDLTRARLFVSQSCR